jgi:hypothetical protein
MAYRGIEKLNLEEVHRYARDVGQLPVESDISGRKAFPKTFVTSMEIPGNSATAKYRGPWYQQRTGRMMPRFQLSIPLVELRHQ